MNQIYCLHLSYSILESSIVLLYVIAAQQYTILIWQRFNLLIAMYYYVDIHFVEVNSTCYFYITVNATTALLVVLLLLLNGFSLC